MNPWSKVLANAQVILARPAHADTSIRDGDLLGTLGGGLAISAVVSWQALQRLDIGWALVVTTLVIPMSFVLAWLVSGPVRLVLEDDELVTVTRLTTHRINLKNLLTVGVEYGLRTRALTLRDGTTLGIALNDLSSNTERFRRLLGHRIVANDMGALAKDANTRKLLGLV